MGSVPRAVLEFDDEVQAPWRPRLVLVSEGGLDRQPEQLRRRASGHGPTRVGACAPPRVDAVGSGPAGGGAARALAMRGEGAVPRPAPGRSGVPRSTRAPVRLTRRARRLAVVLALTLGVGLGALLDDGEGLRLVGGSSVTVQSGDTLWSIATALRGDGDVRELVDEIQRLNGLRGGALQPGQELRLP